MQMNREKKIGLTVVSLLFSTLVSLVAYRLHQDLTREPTELQEVPLTVTERALREAQAAKTAAEQPAKSRVSLATHVGDVNDTAGVTPEGRRTSGEGRWSSTGSTFEAGPRPDDRTNDYMPAVGVAPLEVPAVGREAKRLEEQFPPVSEALPVQTSPTQETTQETGNGADNSSTGTPKLLPPNNNAPAEMPALRAATEPTFSTPGDTATSTSSPNIAVPPSSNSAVQPTNYDDRYAAPETPPLPPALPIVSPSATTSPPATTFQPSSLPTYTPPATAYSTPAQTYPPATAAPSPAPPPSVPQYTSTPSSNYTNDPSPPRYQNPVETAPPTADPYAASAPTPATHPHVNPGLGMFHHSEHGTTSQVHDSGAAARQHHIGQETYSVRPNDNYWKISAAVYGNGGYFRALEEHNRERVPYSDRLRVDDVISTPPLKVLEERYPELCPKARNVPPERSIMTPASMRPAAAGRGRVYKVRHGDTLFDIARNELGKSSRWDEVYELNRDVLGDDFNFLKPGTELILPDPRAHKSAEREPLTTQSRQPYQR